jgi:hypothetical protein
MMDTLDRSALADDLIDKESITLADGRTLRFRQEPDYGLSIDDFDCYGRIAPVGRSWERSTRPDGFDGFARKIRTRSDVYWWQPPEDLRTAKREPMYVQAADGSIHRHPQAYRDPIRSLERIVCDLIEYGFVSLGVEVLKDCASCSRPEVIGSAWIGGVEAMSEREHTVDLLADLIHDAMIEADA